MGGSGEALGFLLYAVIPVLLLFAVQYVALRIRDSRESPRDPHLGRKSLLHLFFNLAIILLLMGFTLSALEGTEYLFGPAVKAQENRKNGDAGVPAVDPTTGQSLPPPPRDWFNEEQRTAAGLTASGLMYAVLFLLAIRWVTNDRDFPAVRRAFAGSRLGLAVLIVMAATTVSLVALFQRGETELKTIQKNTAVVLVWGPTALLHFVLMFRSSGWRNQPGNRK